jgi:hypothetical protein
MKIYVSLSAALRLVFWLLFLGVVFGLAIQHSATSTARTGSGAGVIWRGGVHGADTCDHFLAAHLPAGAAEVTIGS